ncbi:hypothetical protein Ancab_018956, partial [Ancistrocladus abbreviatus]
MPYENTCPPDALAAQQISRQVGFGSDINNLQQGRCLFAMELPFELTELMVLSSFFLAM